MRQAAFQLAILSGLTLICCMPSLAQDAVDVAEQQRQLGKPYVWGAKGPDAFDCSGLVQYSYKQVGILLPEGGGQATSPAVQPVTDQSCPSTHCALDELIAAGTLKRGDLLFFDAHKTFTNTVTHVGIYEGSTIMINAYDEDHGIIQSDLLHDLGGFWIRRFLFARRVNVCPRVPQPGDTTFAPNVAIPTAIIPTACCPLRQFSTVTIGNEQFNGFSDYEFVVRCSDIVDIGFYASDDTYQWLQPDMGFHPTIVQGTTLHIQFETGCPVDRRLPITLVNSSGVQKVAGFITVTSCSQ